MQTLIYKNVLIITKDKQFLGWIEIDDKTKKLLKISKGTTKAKGIDCNKNILMPGFIDSHTHGAFGFSFDNDLKDEKLFKKYLEGMKKEGVVGIVGTTVTSTINKLTNNLKDVKNLLDTKLDNLPSLVGWYFEGPFISKAKKGAHEEKLIIPIDEQFLKNTKNELNKYPIVFTVDAEDQTNRKLINKYQKEFIFALGHSNAQYKDATYVLNNGAKRITHLYNAMSGFVHSNHLGIVNAIFNHEYKKDLCIELIGDGVHVFDEVIKYTYNNIDINNLTLVTDSLSPKGLKNGEYKLGNLDIEKKGNWFYLKGSSTLSGSAVSYNWLLKHFKEVTNCSWTDIVKVSSYNSARNLKLPKNYGDFVVGKKINFVIVDNDFNVVETFI